MEKKEEIIHIRIEPSQRKKWERFFEKQHLDLSNGIRVAVSKFIRDTKTGSQIKEDAISDKIEQLVMLIKKLEDLISEKEQKIISLNYEMPRLIEINNFEELKEEIYKKLTTYGCLGIISLAQLLSIPGEQLLPILKRIKNEPDSKLTMNKNFEWCLK